MTTPEEKQIAVGMQKLNSIQNYLKNKVGNTKLENYWKMLMARLDEFPLECEIRDTRDAVEEMWIKCLKNEEELHVLKKTWSSEYSENTLVKHKRELQELNSFYLGNRELINMINEYDNLWNRLTDLYRQCNNPDRLFKNRGARLLQEEEDRKVIRKLPRVERNILRLLEKQRIEGQEQFLIRGELFTELAKRRWEEHKENTGQLQPKILLKSPSPSRVSPGSSGAGRGPSSAGSVTKRRNLKELQSSSEVKRKHFVDDGMKVRRTSATGSS
ncbi:protein regulator of cytokinesis 1 [Anabrus simplex]|uniref:protein regulator of cytokinesis 1 n=1 Tax=Anabrus simplex TaxID=316456 RepID=UPI0035A2A57D